jgi:hypothetical protein
MLDFRKANAVHEWSLGPKEGMMEVAMFIIMLLVLDVAALLWGVKSTDGADSPEWERRQLWYGFH